MNYFEELSAPIKVSKLKHNGFKYVPIEEVRKRLNKVFDCKWNFCILESTNTEDSIVIKSRLEVDINGQLISKESFGSSEIKKYNRGPKEGKPIDLGNDYKAAQSDALKSCAKMLGVGNFLEEHEEIVEPKEQQEEHKEQPKDKSALAAKLKAMKG